MGGWATVWDRLATGARTWVSRYLPARARHWFARYAPAEVAAVVGALIGAGLAYPLAAPALTAYAGAIGEALCFYGFVVGRDAYRWRASGRPGRPLAVIVSDLAVEFGPAEVVDTALARPLFMYLGPLLVGDVVTGIVLGKVAADVVFYAFAIAGYELRGVLAARPTADDQTDPTDGSSAGHPAPRPVAPR